MAQTYRLNRSLSRSEVKAFTRRDAATYDTAAYPSIMTLSRTKCAKRIGKRRTKLLEARGQRV